MTDSRICLILGLDDKRYIGMPKQLTFSLFESVELQQTRITNLDYGVLPQEPVYSIHNFCSLSGYSNR